MQRDRDEWRRPWTAGAGTVPPLGAAPGAPADAGPDAAAETRLVAGWDAAYDRVAALEVGADRSGPFGRAALRPRRRRRRPVRVRGPGRGRDRGGEGRRGAPRLDRAGRRA
ncbi:MAG: hypothetical protein ACO4BW_06115, partial [Nitriliruptoraceae bacterium]